MLYATETRLQFSVQFSDLFDNMYDLVDSLTFNLRRVSAQLWPIFEMTYKLFKSDAIDFLDGMKPLFLFMVSQHSPAVV